MHSQIKGASMEHHAGNLVTCLRLEKESRRGIEFASFREQATLAVADILGFGQLHMSTVSRCEPSTCQLPLSCWLACESLAIALGGPCINGSQNLGELQNDGNNFRPQKDESSRK